MRLRNAWGILLFAVAAACSREPSKPAPAATASAPAAATTPKPIPSPLPAVVAEVNGQPVRGRFLRLVAEEQIRGRSVSNEQRDGIYRGILDQLIAHGVVPILATKADNRELDERINYDMAVLALEYDVPLWNFWAATGDLPNRGLYTKSSEPYLGDIYLNADGLERHRHTALETLDVVRRAALGE